MYFSFAIFNCVAVLFSAFTVTSSNYDSIPIANEYRVTSVVDLKGDTMTLPDNSRIFFSRRGQIRNGRIVGNGIFVSGAITQVLFRNDVILVGEKWTAEEASSTWFDAKKDCILDKDLKFIRGTNNYQSFQNLLLFDNVSIENGVYYIKGNLRTTRSNQSIEGNGATIKGWFINKFAGIMNIGSTVYSDGKTENIKVANLTLIGVKEEADDAKTEWGHGLVIINSSNVVIDNVRCAKCKGDGFNITESKENGCIYVPKNVNIINCEAVDNYRCGLSITGGQGIRIRLSRFNYTKGTNPQAGIDIEPNSYLIKENTVLSTCTDVLIDSCLFYNNANFGIKIEAHDRNTADYSIHGVKISNCVFNQNRLSVWRVKDLIISDFRMFFDREDNGIVFQNEQQENVIVKNASIYNSLEDASKVIAIYFSPSKRRKNFHFSNIDIRGTYRYGIYFPIVMPGQSFNYLTCENINIKDCSQGIHHGVGIKHQIINTSE